jgi:hypothetical protein
MRGASGLNAQITEKVLEVFAELHQRGFEPNVITYGAISNACVNG